MDIFSEIQFGRLFNRVIGGGTPPRQVDEYWSGQIPWASVKDFKEGESSLLSTQELISEIGLRNSTSKLIPAGVPIICVRMAVGRAAISQSKIAINQDLKALFPEGNVDSKYICYLLEFIRHKVEGKSIGSTVKGISTGELLRIKVPFPDDLPQQQKIAKILTTVDNLIDQTQALIDKYSAIKQGMMADVFTRGLDLSGTPQTNPNYGQLRPSYQDAPELYKETELGWVPREWEVVKLGQCCEVSNNLRKPISAEEREYIKGEYPYCGCTGILDFIDEYRVDGKYVIIGEDGDHFLKFSKQEMTILIEGNFNVNNHAHIVSGTDKCLTEWFHCFFVHRDITYYLTRQGAGRFKLKKETLLNLPILLPSVAEQVEIYVRYTAIKTHQQNERISLEKLHKIKKGLMQDLLTGKVRVTT